MPIFTLQRVEGRLFRPMAWTVAFALLGAMTFSILIAPVLCSLLLRGQVTEWRNPVMVFLTKRYRSGVRRAVEHRAIVVTGALASLALALFLAFSGVIGSEFLPHLDEGAIWARGAMANRDVYKRQTRIRPTGPDAAELPRQEETLAPLRNMSAPAVVLRVSAMAPRA